jgi:nucleotide-binding universal stress UspA family protein
MPTIKHILFPYDFSEQCREAAPFVRDLAARFDASVTIMSVIPPVWDVAPVGTTAVAGMDAAGWTREIEARLALVQREALAHLRVTRIADSGDPALRIVHAADTRAVDLIMMPTHGTGLFRSLLPGSVTSKVLHDARCPVWTAAHAEQQKARSLPQTIVCALDGTPGTPPLLRWAADFTARMGARLRLLHVVGPVTDWPSLGREQALQDLVREGAREKIEAMRLAAGVDAPLRVVVGEVVSAVAEDARQEGADAILIGRGLASATLGRLRTHAFGIIQRSPCPVLSV